MDVNPHQSSSWLTHALPGHAICSLCPYAAFRVLLLLVPHEGRAGGGSASPDCQEPGQTLTRVLEPRACPFTFSFSSSAQAMFLLPLSVLVLLTRPSRSLGAEMKTYSQRTVTNACTLVMCSPMESGLPGRDGRDGREGPRGEKGDPGRAGTMGLCWWEAVGIGIVTNSETLVILLWEAWTQASSPQGVGFPQTFSLPKTSLYWLANDRLP